MSDLVGGCRDISVFVHLALIVRKPRRINMERIAEYVDDILLWMHVVVKIATPGRIVHVYELCNFFVVQPVIILYFLKALSIGAELLFSTRCAFHMIPLNGVRRHTLLSGMKSRKAIRKVGKYRKYAD